jgi:hypothetical protein
MKPAALFCLAAFAGTTTLPAQTISIDWVTVGNAAQSAASWTHADSRGDDYDSVSYTYRIAQCGNTIPHYSTFIETPINKYI